MTRTKNTIGISAVAFFASALVGVACSSDPSGNTGTGGLGGAISGSGAGGRLNVAGAAGRGGSNGVAGSGTGGASGSGGSGVVNSCTLLPANLLLTDFSAATLQGVSDGATWNAGKGSLWGNATSLKGGDVFYQGKAGSAARVSLNGETLTVTATIEAGDYMGYMFNFAPKCTNASATQGLQFDVLDGSTLGNATLKVQMQQKSDYPSTANPSSRPGDCVPTSVDTQYNECLSPGTIVVNSGSTLSSGSVQLPWTNFSGGQPVAALDSSQLMAIQWQFECPATGGTVSGAGGSGGAAGGAGGAGSSSGGASGSSGVGGLSSGGASGSSGAASGGTSGDSGSGGTAGSSGSAGSETAGASGTAGSGGTAGSSGTAGTAETAGTAGSSVAAGAGGTGGATPPCVVTFKLDNVKFY